MVVKPMLLAAILAAALASSSQAATCDKAPVPTAIDSALSTVCLNYLSCDRGGDSVEKACRSCQMLRQQKLAIEQSNRACDAQTVPAADQKAIDDALRAGAAAAPPAPTQEKRK